MARKRETHKPEINNLSYTCTYFLTQQKLLPILR